MMRHLSSRLHINEVNDRTAPNLNPKTVSMLRRLSATDRNQLFALCSAMNAKELSKLPEDILQTVKNFQQKAAQYA